MCSNVYPDEIHRARNESIVGTQKGEGSTLIATVLKSTDPKFPVGTQVSYKNDMGHVLCAGNDGDHQDECDMHPLDAVGFLGDRARREEGLTGTVEELIAAAKGEPVVI